MRFSLTSDSFNPMLVRDLRQGLRSRRFSGLFLLLHGAMAFCVILVLMTSEKVELVGMLNAVLCGGLFIYFYVGLPLTATSAFTTEYLENRMDLLKLTQMSARGLVWGKWWSYFAQGAMVAVSLLPYLILTYFIGGVELASELSLIALLLGLSALLVGACLTISCINLQVFRVLFVLFLIFNGLYSTIGVITAIWGGYSGMFGVDELGALGLLMMLAGVPALFLFLEFGASRLAPLSENHDTPQRLVALLLLAMIAVLFGVGCLSGAKFWDDFILPFAVISMLEALWVMVFAASSEPLPFPAAYRPFVRRGSLGKWVGRLLLYPGWPSAVFFISLFAGVELAVFFILDATRIVTHMEWNVVMGICALLPPALLFPQLVSQWLRATRLSSGLRYFVAALGSVILLLVGSAFSSVSSNSIFVVLACILPPNAWLFFSFNLQDEIYEPLRPVAVLFAAIGGTLVMAIMIGRALRHWRQFAELERRAEASLSLPSPPADTAASPQPLPPAVPPPASGGN